MYLIYIALFSYLLGSVPFSYLVAKLYGKNIQEIGSKNVGAANVYRATGKIDALILAIIGDGGKGALAIFLVQKFGFLGYNLFLAQAIAAFFIVLGHNWPLFLLFRGGRGLASLVGVIAYLNWKIIILVALVVSLVILLTELIMKKKIKLNGSLKEKLKQLLLILISQLFGRVIGILVAAILVYILYPQTFKIIFAAVILAGLKHVKRTQTFLADQK